jgi:hypothetical protein
VADASFVRRGGSDVRTFTDAAGAGEIRQARNGLAEVLGGTAGASAGDQRAWLTTGQWAVTKAAGVVLLDGGPVYWDASANAATFKKVNDRDFYLGSLVGDAASANTTCTVSLNVAPRYLLDLARDPFLTALVGTQALGGLSLLRRGGAHGLVLGTTNEAQKADALSVDGFDKAARAIVELAVRVVSGGTSAAPDFNVGLANGTHATDADAIAEHLFVHLDGNSPNVNLQSKDGTTTVAAVDTTVDYAAGTRFEVWFDLRNTADIQAYVDGINVLPASVFRLDNSTGPLKLLAHAEKTADASAFEAYVDWLRVRIAD